jgi:hypothetical protein
MWKTPHSPGAAVPQNSLLNKSGFEMNPLPDRCIQALVFWLVAAAFTTITQPVLPVLRGGHIHRAPGRAPGEPAGQGHRHGPRGAALSGLVLPLPFGIGVLERQAPPRD